ncbi:DUF2490 domain-containing protein [Hymenobacter sp. BT683]|uniref:DUF2490 domain-containing protein n=1 Tax=Hymenobacter jeongseonensis TaxID=2791027 RepID=A0ABS0ILC0_9BACT|nr:DUF2490 domain-containing protein [Hymenobacter jeongseonensis]MBF9239151.1 DUF2490 domain-containing protein [Hymenobacter jeongseonensis]
MKHLFSSFILALLTGTAQGQGGGGGAPVGWMKLSADLPLRGRWSMYSEVETRQSNAQLTAQQLGRLGFRLNVSPNFSLTTGYVLAANECRASGDESTTPEHRLYQEVAVNDATGAIRAGHRLRAEERWLRATPEAAFRFAPRLRYQLRLVLPLRAGGTLPIGGVFLVVGNEVFAGLGRREGRSFLEENRASAGLGYRVSRHATVEMAYLHQTQAAGSAGASLARNAVQVSVAVARPNHLALVRR